MPSLSHPRHPTRPIASHRIPSHPPPPLPSPLISAHQCPFHSHPTPPHPIPAYVKERSGDGTSAKSSKDHGHDVSSAVDNGSRFLFEARASYYSLLAHYVLSTTSHLPLATGQATTHFSLLTYYVVATYYLLLTTCFTVTNYYSAITRHVLPCTTFFHYVFVPASCHLPHTAPTATYHVSLLLPPATYRSYCHLPRIAPRASSVPKSKALRLLGAEAPVVTVDKVGVPTESYAVRGTHASSLSITAYPILS